MGAEPGDRGAEPGHRVVVVDHRPVAGAAAGGQLHPGHALLGGLDQVDPPAAHRGAEAADLAHRVGDALELLGVLVDQHLGAPVAAGLLVGGEAERDRPLRHPALALPLPDHGEQHRVEVLHVDGPAAPEVAVLDLPGERVDPPVLASAGTTSRWPCSSSAVAAPGRPSAPSPTSGRARTRRAGSRSRPPRAARRRTRPPCAPPARSRRRSCWCRSGSGRDTGPRPRSRFASSVCASAMSRACHGGRRHLRRCRSGGPSLLSFRAHSSGWRNWQTR